MMKYLEYILRMQSIAKVGLKFSKDPYAIENYQLVEELSREMLENYTSEKLERDNYYIRDIYPTPSVSVRVLVEKDNKYLFVREIDEQKYVIPGGWCEVFETARDNAIAEVLQESGYQVEIDRILAVFNHGLDRSITSEYSIIFSGKIIGGSSKLSHETDDVNFYEEDKLPILSHKVSEEEYKIIFDIYKKDKLPYFD